jgi:hypothetical protein
MAFASNWLAVSYVCHWLTNKIRHCLAPGHGFGYVGCFCRCHCQSWLAGFDSLPLPILAGWVCVWLYFVPLSHVDWRLKSVDVEALDPTGTFVQELCGTRKSVKSIFSDLIAHEPRMRGMLERDVVCGLCHNDLHGGKLLLDSQGLVWLFDFATVKNNVHVLMDFTKFPASCLFLYLHESVSEKPI